jgi:hypothetical protein
MTIAGSAALREHGVWPHVRHREGRNISNPDSRGVPEHFQPHLVFLSHWFRRHLHHNAYGPRQQPQRGYGPAVLGLRLRELVERRHVYKPQLGAGPEKWANRGAVYVLTSDGNVARLARWRPAILPWSEAARVSSSVTSGLKLKSGRLLRHMAGFKVAEGRAGSWIRVKYG